MSARRRVVDDEDQLPLWRALAVADLERERLRPMVPDFHNDQRDLLAEIEAKRAGGAR